MKPDWCWNWILKFNSSRSAINFQRHDVHLGVIELNPGHVLRVRTEPDGPRVADDFLFVDPVTNAVKDGPGGTFL